MVLIDTCVWIDFLTGRETPHSQLLEALLEDGDACVCDVTYAEICIGAKDDRQCRKFANDFSQIPFLSLPPQWHRDIAHMGYQLRRRGYTPYIADLQIGFTAIHHKADLLTSDKDFLPYRKLFSLSLLSGDK